MRVGFEAKRVFHNNTGLGNYGRDVIRILNKYSSIERFFLYNTRPSPKKRIEPSDKIKVRYPESALWKKFPSIWRLGPVASQIQKDDIDIYHGLSGEIPSGLSSKNIPAIVTIHDLIFLSHPYYYSFFERMIYAKKARYAAVNANKVIAISEQTKRDIVKYLNVDEKKIEIVYQGCNKAYKKTYDRPTREAVRQKYGLPEKYILNVGTLQERKNALTIVKAIRQTEYHLVLIGGEKSYAKKIHTYIKKHALERQVSFLKNVEVEELAAIYQMATIFCYPSFCEGFGIPIIEALFSKTPVITSKNNCFPEAGGPNSVYIEPTDANTLRQEFDRLFSSKVERDRIAEEGYAYVQKFSDANVAGALIEVYKSVLR